MNTLNNFTDSLLVENYAWVDQRLKELYYSYALTAENCDEFQDAGLLTEKWAWVDESLRKKYYGYALTSENCDEYEASGLLCPAPLAWVDYRERVEDEPIEEDTQDSVLGKRSRTESEISDHEEEVVRVVERLGRLGFQSPFPANYDYTEDCESSQNDEADSVKGVTSDCLSEASTIFEEDLDGYDSDDWYAHCARIN
jgi:hypothetical protein